MPPSSSFLVLLNQCLSCLHITFHSRYGRLSCSVTAFSCWGSQTHISLSHLFLSYHFLSVFLLFYLFHHLPSTSSLPPMLRGFNLPPCQYHFLLSLSSFSPSNPSLCSHFCPPVLSAKGKPLAAITRKEPEWQDTLQREINLSLSGRPSVALTRFSCTAASGVWKSAAAVWGSRYLWGVLHPDVYAACNHK